MFRLTIAAALLSLLSSKGSAQAAPVQQPYKKEIPAKLAAQARITEAVAATTALAKVPGGAIRSVELEREKGKLIYSYDIKVAGKPGIEEVHVDAMSGTVTATEHEKDPAPKPAKTPAKKPSHA